MNPVELEAAVRAADAAPSVHGTGPWRFSVEQGAPGAGTVDLYADRDRQLRHVDPLGRLLTISCGIALCFLREALHRQGHDTRVELLPDAADLDHLAAVTVAAGRRPPAARPGPAEPSDPPAGGPWAAAGIPPDRARLRDKIADVVGVSGVWLRWLDSGHDRAALQALTIRAARILSADFGFRSELRDWLRGGPFDSVLQLGPADDLVIVGTPFDGPTSWLDAGQGVGMLLLCASGAAVPVAPLGEALTVPWTRKQVAARLGLVGHPQLVLRVGAGAADAGAPASWTPPVATVRVDGYDFPPRPRHTEDATTPD